jgi:hypothetical protein
MNENGLWLPASSTKEDKIEKWWEVNRKHDPPLTRGATPLVERCMRVHAWGEPFARRTLKGYRQFMELKSVMNDWQETKLSAPIAIQQMWEQHILDNLNYTDDCFLLFGRVIGHDPDACLNDRFLVDRIKTTKIAFQARYGNDMDPDVWDFGPTEVETMVVDGDDHQTVSHSAASNNTPRGRLPVATIDRGASSISPRSRSLVVASEEETTPIPTETVRDRSPAPHQPTARASPITSKPQRTPKSPSGNDPITIFLRDQGTGEETYFSLRYRSTLRIVFTVFAERKGLSQENLKFSFNGQTLTGYETPYSLGLEDRARIDVQIGQRRG